jgi:hypothetical protein
MAVREKMKQAVLLYCRSSGNVESGKGLLLCQFRLVIRAKNQGGGFTLQKRQSFFHPKQNGRSGFNHFLSSSPLGPPPILITDLLQAISSNLFFTDNCLSKSESKSLICENEVI